MANRNYPKNVTATTVIPFDNPVSYIPPKTVTGPITFTKTTTGAQAGYCSIIRVVANGSNTPDLSAFKSIGIGTWDNTSGVVNQLWFVFDGVDYCVAITHPTTIAGGGGGTDTTPPTLVSGNATDATHITLVFSEAVVPTVVGWTVGDGVTTFSFSSVSGSGTTWTFVVSGTLTSSMTLSVAYSATTGNTLDTAGNELASLGPVGITNSIGGSSSLLTGLQHYWKLEDVNASAGSATLTNTNTVTFGAGKVNNAATFVRASSQRLSHATAGVLSTNFTVNIWAKITGGSNIQGLIGRYNATGTHEWIFYWDGGLANVLISADGSTDTTIQFNVPDASWHMYTITFDGTTVKVYTDNTLTISHAFTGPVFTDAANPLYFGDIQNLASRALDGQLDEIGIWSREITSPERTSLYNSGTGTTYPTF